MPTYEFRCPKGHDFQRFYKTISAGASELPCPECGELAVRQLSVGGLVFKGSGFYLTDYGKNAHRGSESGKKGEGAPSEGKGEGGKAESGKSEGAKTEGSKPESAKSESAKSEGPKPKAQSAEPKAQSAESKTKSPPPKPKSE